MAARWRDAGATWLHVVNLDGAFGEAGTANRAALDAIVAAGVPVQFGGGQAGESGRTGMLLQVTLRHVVPIDPPRLSFRGVPGSESPSINAENQSFQQKRSLSARIVGPRSAIGGENSVYVIPGLLVDQGRVLTGVPGGFVADFTQVGAINQHLVDETLVNELSIPDLAVLGCPCLRSGTIQLQFTNQLRT